jgi:RNase P protein component
VRGADAFAALARPREHAGTRRRSGPVTVSFVPASAVPAPGGAVPERPCVAFAIGRRVGSAVVRNRLRRRLRDEVARLASDGQLRPGAYLVGLSPAAVEVDGPTLRAHLRTALGISA